MDNAEWRNKQKAHWPTGSLERSLTRDFPGSKSLLDALNKTISSNTPGTATQTMENARSSEPTEKEKYLAMREAIKSIELETINGFDTDLIPKEIRERLANIPINSIDEAKFWADCWIKEIKKIREQSGDMRGDDSSR